MIVKYFPEYKSDLDSAGATKKVIKELNKKYPKIYSLVSKTFKELDSGELTIQELIDDEWFGTIDGLWEFRIPPNHKKGVFRAYCDRKNGAEAKKVLASLGHNVDDINDEDEVILIYSSEIKKNFNPKPNAKILKNAKDRNEIYDNERKKIEKQEKRNGKK